MRPLTIAAPLAAALIGAPAIAQLGRGWTAYTPPIKLHLDGSGDGMVFDWKPYATNCSPTPCVDYRFDSATRTETFRLLDNRTNRSEVRLHNDYRTGSRQFEGWVTIFAPLNDESLMQIFGSNEGATQLMVRGFAAQGGSIQAQGRLLASGCYGKELRVNVIHEQEDAGNRIRVYIDGAMRLEFPDNERVANYHKYGCYGSLRTPEAVVKWRDVRHFQDGDPPDGNVSSIASPHREPLAIRLGLNHRRYTPTGRLLAK